MTREEYVKTLEKVAADNAVNAKHDDYYDGYFDGLKKAIKLTKELDEPKKVVIPKFVADWIAEAKSYYINDVDSLGIVYWICNHCTDTESNYEWLKNIDNQKLLLNVIANGYEVKEDPKYRIRAKGIAPDKKNVLRCRMCTKSFELAGPTGTNGFKTEFTKKWLKDNWPEYESYHNAGLLEFEGVED